MEPGNRKKKAPEIKAWKKKRADRMTAEIKKKEEKTATRSWSQKTLKIKCVLKYTRQCCLVNAIVLSVFSSV